MELKKVPLNDIHEKLGAKMVPFAGFNMPVRYSSDIEEHMTVRNGVGVFDVSHMGEFSLKGPDALDLIQRVTSNDASKLVDGQAQYSCLPNSDGGIVDNVNDSRESSVQKLPRPRSKSFESCFRKEANRLFHNRHHPHNLTE